MPINPEMRFLMVSLQSMIKESFIIRSTISSQLMKSTLLKGFCLAFIGILGLLFGGIFLSVSNLKLWGWILFLLCLGLITLGLLPYRRLSRLQLKPSEFVLVDSDYFVFYSKGKKIMTIPLQAVARLSYIEQPKLYGIALWLKHSPHFPIIIHQDHQETDTLREKGQQIGKADLFFPYFNQRAYEELRDWLSSEENSS